MKSRVLLASSAVFMYLFTLGANADNTTVNVYINNAPQQHYGYSSGTMCSRHGGFCTNGVYIMSTRKTYYSPSRSRMKSQRSQRLGLNI